MEVSVPHSAQLLIGNGSPDGQQTLVEFVIEVREGTDDLLICHVRRRIHTSYEEKDTQVREGTDDLLICHMRKRIHTSYEEEEEDTYLLVQARDLAHLNLIGQAHISNTQATH